MLPVFSPMQFQVNCDTAELTVDAVPAAHRLALGALSAATPLAVPQTPLTICPKLADTVQSAVMPAVV